jgi:hypothetical protein
MRKPNKLGDLIAGEIFKKANILLLFFNDVLFSSNINITYFQV